MEKEKVNLISHVILQMKCKLLNKTDYSMQPRMANLRTLIVMIGFLVKPSNFHRRLLFG